MFLKFSNLEERRNYGGSSFIEFAYCKKKKKFKSADKFLKVKYVMWQDDSLYIHFDDFDKFNKIYNDILNVCDFCGPNYYTKEMTIKIIKLLVEKQPEDYQVLLDWLKIALEYNGFFIYGI